MSTPPYKLDDPTNLLWPHIQSYREYFDAGRFKSKQPRRYLACVLHFGDWLRSERLAPTEIDASVVDRFLSRHLPHCDCRRPVPRDLINNRASLNHLVRRLREQGVMDQPIDDEISRELASFDARMAEVWGLSAGTRAHRCRVIRRLLKSQFRSRAIDIAALSPAAIREFVVGDVSWTRNTIRMMAVTVRCYLRHRALLGDEVGELLRAIPRPAHWRDAALPETLSADELEQLLRAFDAPCPSRRRGYAIVRCLVDLGLRSSEVIGLRLDDINWKEGTIRIGAGKARRADVLPLPVGAGEAIASYLLHERPETNRREIFVRHVGPLGEPVGRRVVQKTLHAAYKRLGWDRTHVHVLRHTLASRLINSGATMKQIADVLRHRSVVTSAGYARVDVSRLSAVALPWPGVIA